MIAVKLISFVFDVKIKHTLALWSRKHTHTTHLGLNDEQNCRGSDLFSWLVGLGYALITIVAPAQAYRIVRSPNFTAKRNTKEVNRLHCGNAVLATIVYWCCTETGVECIYLMVTQMIY